MDLGILPGLATAFLVIELIAAAIGVVALILILLFVVLPMLRGRR